MKQNLALALAVLLAVPGHDFGQIAPPEPSTDIAVLQLKVIEGEAVAHVAGTRSNSPLTVQVSDETGRPVSGVTVSFRLPTDGATGLFESGLPTEVLVTGADGKATVSGIRWGKTAGPSRIRITAVRGEVRGGIFSSQYVSEAVVTTANKGSEPNRPTVSKGRSRWMVFAVVAAGAAAGGLAVGLSGKAAGTPGGGAAASQTSTSLDIGAPAIQVGRP